MLHELIPPFEIHRVFIDPWANDLLGSLWIFLMGFLVCTACGLIGNFLVVRRMALVGDAISHSLLPGIALAFLLTSTRTGPAMLVGAVLAGILTTVLIEFIHRQSRIKTDAALGIVFPTFFAIGVILISLYADQVDIDAECVLYGEIGYVSLEPPIKIAGLLLGPQSLVQMASVTLGLALLVWLFYRQLLVTSFDPGLARSVGIPVNFYHYGLMIVLSIVIVSAFESVGVVLVIAMLIFPGATGALLAERLPSILWLSLLLAALYAGGGLHLAIWLDCSIAGAMVVIAGIIFGLTWIFSPKHGLWRRWRAARVAWPAKDPEQGHREIAPTS